MAEPIIPPLPTPFSIPPPMEGSELIVDPFWDYETILESLSGAQTIVVMADNNGLIGAIVWGGVLLLVVGFLVKFVSSRGDNV